MNYFYGLFSEQYTYDMSSMMLYKYAPINKFTISNLIHEKNWYSDCDPKTFNDPFEFSIRDGLYFWQDEKLKFLNKTERASIEIIKQSTREIGVVCYTEASINNPLMWSHYSDNHRGICLGFEIKKPYPDNLYKVIYSDQLLKLNDSKQLEDIQNEIFSTITTKATPWSYEREWRQFETKKNILGDYPGKLAEVIFGCSRCPENDIKTIWKILIDKYGTSVKFGKAKIQAGTFNLQFTFHPEEQNNSDRFPKFNLL